MEEGIKVGMECGRIIGISNSSPGNYLLWRFSKGAQRTFCEKKNCSIFTLLIVAYSILSSGNMTKICVPVKMLLGLG